MLKGKFEKLAKVKVTEEDFKVLKDVLLYHPQVNSPQQLVDIHLSGGMDVIHEMDRKAQKVKNLMEEIYESDKKEKSSWRETWFRIKDLEELLQ